MKQITRFILLALIITSIVSCQTTSIIESEYTSVPETPFLDDEDIVDFIVSIDYTITFSVNEVVASHSTIDISKTSVIISTSGTYFLSGSSDNMQIIIDVSDSDQVTLVFNQLSLTSLIGPVIDIKNAKKVIIHVNEGTENSLSDSSESTISYSGLISSKDDLTIKGSGSLILNSNKKNAIDVNDDLIISSTNISINSVNHGIKVNNNATFINSFLVINSDGDSIKVEHLTDSTLGNIIINGGSYTMEAFGDGMDASGTITIFQGVISIISGSKNLDVNKVSGKGIKSRGYLTIIDGILSINSIDDCIHSNTTVIIHDGEFVLNSSDDGIHSDEQLIINNGIINIDRCYEGLESLEIILNGGNINITSQNDGINATGGNVVISRTPWSNPSTGKGRIIINDGYIIINSNGDGIDANGSITMNGGLVIINGPSIQMDGAIDYDTSFEINGGTLIAAGSIGMAQNVSSSSTQCSLLINLTSTTSQLINIQNSLGVNILTFQATKPFQSLVFSSPNLEISELYKIYLGGSVDSYLIYNHGLYQQENYVLGVAFMTFTINSITTTIGTSTSGGSRPR